MNTPIVSRRAFGFALAAAGALAGVTAAAQSDVGLSRAEAQVRAEAITRRYIEKLRLAGVAPSGPAPRIAIAMTPQLSFYVRGVVTLPIWADAPPQLRGLVDNLAGATGGAISGGGMTGEALFGGIFNAFIVPHELTHWYEDSLGARARRLEHYETELRANQVAVAYWLGEPGGPARMQRLMGAIAAAAPNMPSPIPPGADPARYFNDNYAALGANPSAYGYYQFHLFLDAWSKRDQASFAELVRGMRTG